MQFKHKILCIALSGVFVIVGLLGITSLTLAQGNPWATKANMPTPRALLSTSVVDGVIYAIGGGTGPYSDFSTVEAYDPKTDTWTKKINMPTPRAGLSTCAVDGIIYAIGGHWSPGLATVEAYNPVTDNWTSKTPMPTSRGFLSVSVVDGIIYAIGGCKDVTGIGLSNVEAYDPKTDTWTEKAPMPTARLLLTTCEVDGIIYAIGGASNFTPGASTLKTVEAYDPAANTWIKKTDMPTSRAMSATVIDGMIYAIGGVAYGGGPGLSTAEAYDPITNTWTKKTDMPTPRKYLSCSAVDGKIYAIGGANSGGQVLAIVEEYDPAYHTDIQTGNVSGTWTLANSPYHINGEITIPDGQTLTIEPGVKVIFTGHYKFNVQGRLLAIGTQLDTITFTPQNPETGWHGIRFMSTPQTNDTAKIIYCKLQYGKANTGNDYDISGGAIFVLNFSKLIISNCLLHHNSCGSSGQPGGGAICLWNSSSIICSNTLLNNNAPASGVGGGIICWQNANASISNNLISNNTAGNGGAGIYIGSSNPIVINNIITKNHSYDEGGGIRCNYSSRPLIINNTIVNNQASSGGGIHCDGNSDPILINTILYGNTANTGNQAYLADSGSDPNFLFCDIKGGKDHFKGAGAGVNYSGVYEHNIDSDPLFMSAEADDFHLSDSSFCIGGGNDSVQVGTKWYQAPPFDFEGNSRPNPKSSKPDIGALENILGNPVTGIQNGLNQMPNQFHLYQNYPNPFNPQTRIKYELPHSGKVVLKVYNIVGEEICTLVDEVKPAGSFEVLWDGRDNTGYLVASGVYLYRIEAQDPSASSGQGFVQTKKMLLLQ
jgi:parallel beta-helix repeat protein